jgi:hypothetical protein
MRSFITRKEIAAILEVSVDTVRRREVVWGIHIFKREISGRQIDYHAAPTRAKLVKLGLMPHLRDSP